MIRDLVTGADVALKAPARADALKFTKNGPRSVPDFWGVSAVGYRGASSRQVALPRSPLSTYEGRATI